MSLESMFAEQTPAPLIERPPPRDRGDITVTVPSGWTIQYNDKTHRYKLDGEYVKSVSTIIGCLDKPALPWWGMKIGVEGVLELTRRGALTSELIANAEMDSVVQMLTQEKLTTNHVKREAADRGSRVHDVMEDWANTGVLPDPLGLPADEQGYIHGLIGFIHDVQPEPGGVEAIVASKEHGFAGRCDLLRLTIPEPVLACVRIDYKTGEETRTIIPAGTYLVDLKTSSGVWKEAHFQVAGYEGASIESGYEPTDHQAILRVTVDGKYELVESVATYQDFLAVKQAFDATRRIEKAA